MTDDNDKKHEDEAKSLLRESSLYGGLLGDTLTPAEREAWLAQCTQDVAELGRSIARDRLIARINERARDLSRQIHAHKPWAASHLWPWLRQFQDRMPCDDVAMSTRDLVEFYRIQNMRNILVHHDHMGRPELLGRPIVVDDSLAEPVMRPASSGLTVKVVDGVPILQLSPERLADMEERMRAAYDAQKAQYDADVAEHGDKRAAELAGERMAAKFKALGAMLRDKLPQKESDDE